MHPATVYLVGAGPGDPGLITLRAVECLGRADLVLYDYLVNPRLLEHARPGAELICLGRHGRGGRMTQAEINQQMVEAALSGRVVVRLKGGDPMVFAHAAEETSVLEAAGIRYEIVPGITVAFAASAYAGVALTNRDESSAVALVTGQEDFDKEQSALDYRALAQFPGTLVFYMGVTSAERWSKELMAAGKPPQTPVAIVRRCSFPDQQRIDCTLATLTDTIHVAHLRPPVVMIVGSAASVSRQATWFIERPLFGKTIVVTRPAGQNASIQKALEDLGARVLVQPAITIGPPDDWRKVNQAIARLPEFDWLVFSSVNGVAAFDRLAAKGLDARAIGRAQLAAIGSGTAEALSARGLIADLVPDAFHAEALADALAPQASARRFLLLRASRGREVLAERLTQAGGQVEQVVVYSSRDVTAAEPEIAALLSDGRIDWVTVTSSAIARSLAELFGKALQHTALASISPVTSATLRELGLSPQVEAAQFTPQGLVEAIRTS